MIRLFWGMNLPHPVRDPHGTLLHFPIISLMLPGCTLGATMATLVSKVVPDLYIVIYYVVIMIGV